MTATPTTPLPPASELDVVRRALGAEYDVLDELGRGGMAVVYRALEREAQREVAIKVLPPQFAFDESFVERFQREGRIAAQLEHPHIVPVYRVGRKGHVIYFAMKLLRGESLSDRIRARGRLGAPDVRRILMETASALGYAAKHGVVHRDVKPDNILLDVEGRCVVTDFGIARSASDSKLTATGMSVGTPRYMSPEQARAKPLDGRSDIYSLGVVGYECLVGTPPFDGGDAFAILMEHIRAPLPRPALATAEEWDVYEIIERMLAKDPDDRFQSADELIAALGGERTATGRGVAFAPQRETLTPTRPQLPVGTLDQDEASGPRSSAALDRALDVGLQLVRQQKPKVARGLATGRDLVRSQQPRLDAAKAATVTASRRAQAFVMSRTRRFWIAAGVAVLTLTGATWGVHVATMHRTRCPAPQSAASTGGRPPSFSVLVDAIGTRSQGDLDVYYDVCGLANGTSFTTAVRVTRNQSGFKRFLGGAVTPVTDSWNESAGGPAERRHRTLDFDEMPEGSYKLSVVVTDAGGRVRARETTFQVR